MASAQQLGGAGGGAELTALHSQALVEQLAGVNLELQARGADVQAACTAAHQQTAELEALEAERDAAAAALAEETAAAAALREAAAAAAEAAADAAQRSEEAATRAAADAEAQGEAITGFTAQVRGKRFGASHPTQAAPRPCAHDAATRRWRRRRRRCGRSRRS